MKTATEFILEDTLLQTCHCLLASLATLQEVAGNLDVTFTPSDQSDHCGLAKTLVFKSQLTKRYIFTLK